MAGKITKVWKFTSSSNPNNSYETLQYEDGSTSCNCMGWCRRVAPDGSRSCKHTRAVDLGTADQEATTSLDYQTKAQKAAPIQTQTKTVAKKAKLTPVPGRKILWQ